MIMSVRQCMDKDDRSDGMGGGRECCSEIARPAEELHCRNLFLL